MIPSHFPLMIMAETRKVFTRGSGYFVLGLSFVVGLLTFLMMWRISSGQSQISINNQQAGQLAASWTAIDVAGWALFMRNLFILPVSLVLATAASVAGEFGDRTMRELLVRPVSRMSVLLAKLISLEILSVVSLAITLSVSFLGGLAIGVPSDATKVLELSTGYLASAATDFEWIALAVVLAVFLQSTGGVVVGMVVGLGLDLLLMGFLKVVSLMGLEQASELIKFTVWNGLFAWTGWEWGWEGLRMASVLIVTGVALVVGIGRFSQQDVL